MNPIFGRFVDPFVAVGRGQAPAGLGASPEAGEKSAVAAYGVVDAQRAEGVPEGGGLAGDDGFAEVVLEAVDDSGGGEAGAADEEGIGVRDVGLAGERVGTLFRLVVDVHHVSELTTRHDLESHRLPVRVAGDADRLGVRAHDGHPAYAELLERLEHDLGKPVVTSQCATLWYALRALKIDDPVRGYGSLLAGGA